VTTIKIKKEDAIKAVIEEPVLKAGLFFHDDFRSKKICPVCAVGSVLRNTVHSMYWDDVLVTMDDFDHNDNYVNAPLDNLSITFEAACMNYNMNPNSDETRMLLLFEIEGFWPDVLEIEVL